MKVAMVGPYPVNRPITGGIEAVAHALAIPLRLLPGLELHIVTRADDGTAKVGPDEANLHVVPAPRFSRANFYRTERGAITRLLRELQPDVVHVQGQNFYALGSLAAGLPTVVTLHGMLFREAKIVDPRSHWSERIFKRLRGFFNARFEAITLQRARHLIVINPYVSECIAGRTHARSHAIDNPIGDEFFAVSGPEEAGRLFFAGAIEPRKGLHQLIDAIAGLHSRGQHATLRLAGRTLDAGYKAALDARIAAAGLRDVVRFLGLIPQADLLAEYAAASVIVMASQEETSPMLIQQAMAAGKPVVASAAGGIPHLVQDGVSGRLFPTGDTPALVAALEELLAAPAQRRAFGNAARQAAEARFRASAVAARTLTVYEEALREVAPSRRRALGRVTEEQR
jgi:glycosyltransferase involved in cell wall biosynthesis